MTLTKYNAAGEMLQGEARFAPNGVVCSVYLSASTGAASGLRKVPFNTTRFDPFGYFDLTNSRFQPKIPGYYRFNALVDVGAAGGYAFLQWYKNGAYYAYGYYIGPAPTSETMMSDSIVIYLNGSTDYVELWGSTSNAIPIFGGFSTRLEVNLVAASVGVAPEPWHFIGAVGEPAFGSGWSVHSFAPKFMKDPHGFVHVAGRVQTTGVQATVFTLPVGYRPGDNVGAAFAGYINPNRVVANLQLPPSGAYNVLVGNDSSTTPFNFCHIDFTFRAEQ